MLDAIETNATETAGGDTSPASQSTKLKGICILGSNPHTKMLAPFGDPGFLIYACSPDNSPHGAKGNIPKGGPPLSSALPRVDAFFEIHKPVFDRTRPYAYLEWLSQQPFPLWMRDEVAMGFRNPAGQPLFPNAQVYPDKVVREVFGPFTFTSSIALIMAKAALDIKAMMAKGIMGTDGPPEMPLYGILQMGKDEYAKQRQGTQNMIWAISRLGIKVQVAAESGLLEPPPEDF